MLSRLRRAVHAWNTAPSMQKLQEDIDLLIREKETETKAIATSNSKLEVRRTDHDMAYAQAYTILRGFSRKGLRGCDGSLPGRGDPSRDSILCEIWKEEPILAGAVYSMTAKMAALRWTMTGRRNKSLESARILSRAAVMGGYDWGAYISSGANDFYTTNRGFFTETAKNGDPLTGSLSDIGHIDALNCILTGNSEYPMQYVSMTTGQSLRFRPGEYFHFASMPSPREMDLGAGFCAVDRSLRAATLLMGLHDYDEEKLNNLPPEGVAAVSGLTMQEFQDALEIWRAARERDESLTFPQVLWLLGSQPESEVKVNFNAFSQMPESFDRKTVIEQYVQTVALDFGVDVREFWSISSGALGTAGESEIQHLKAKGKGPGEFITTTERHINGELPEGVDFAFDTQDIEEDANAAAVAKAWVDAFMPIYNLPQGEGKGKTPPEESKANPNPEKPNGAPKLPRPNLPRVDTGDQMTMGGGQPNTPKMAEQVIDKDQFLRLLADKGVLPDYMVYDQRTVIADTDVHNKNFTSEGAGDDITRYEWDRGVLKEVRLPPIVLYSSKKEPSAIQPTISILPEPKLAEELKEAERVLQALREKEAKIMEQHRNIHGAPIPDKEVARGTKVNKKTIHDELERWRSHPILSKYALTAEEEEKLLESGH